MPKKSVAVQGLPALEYVLYGTGADELQGGAPNYRCRAGEAMAGNIANVARTLTEAWDAPDGVQSDWKEPGPDNGIYRDAEEATIGLLGVVVHGVEHIRDHRIKRFYWPLRNVNKPKMAIYHRSDNTFRSIAVNLEGLQTIWVESGMQGFVKGDASAVNNNITFDFKTAIETARALDYPIAEILGDDKLRLKLDYLELLLADLQSRLNTEYGGAIGLAAGFSFSDGD
jgi:predicted lipoprotein